MALRGKNNKGTTLVEVLVVIVIFLVGILAILNIFPTGLRIISQQRDKLVAQQLNKSFLQNENGKSNGLAEQILPVRYQLVSGQLQVLEDPTRRPTDLGLNASSIDANGLATINGTTAGHWGLLSGANVFREVVNETHVVPAPRAVGAQYGGLLLLNYGPMLQGTDLAAPALTYSPKFSVTSDALLLTQGVPGTAQLQDYQCFLDGADQTTATLYMPRFNTAAGKYSTFTVRLSATINVVASGTVQQRDLIFTTKVNSDPSGTYYPYVLKNEADFKATIAPSDQLLSVDPNSVVVVRNYDLDTNAGTWDAISSYTYKMVDTVGASLLFNPSLKDKTEYRPSGSVPPIVKVSYNVYDWRIIRDDFRIPTVATQPVSLMMRSIVSLSRQMADGKAYKGLNVPLPSWDGTTVGTENRDFALVDTETGGVYLPDSYNVDYTQGVISFLNADASAASFQMKLILPGSMSPTTINAGGRSVRALYRANGEWAPQWLRASAVYRNVAGTPGAGQYYIGGSGMLGGSTARIYFPWADLGQTVEFDQITYTASGTKKVLRAQSLPVVFTSDSLGAPYVDIRTLDPDPTSAIDMTDGYGVRGVHGTSVTARTVWNQGAFLLGSDGAQNAKQFDSYRQDFKTLQQTTTILGGSVLR